MDSESPPSPSSLSPRSRDAAGKCCCDCRCSCFAWHRSVKRKFDQIAADGHLPRSSSDVVARVEVENECAALREALASQQQTIQELSMELDEERNAAASSASEAMSMILRLQKERAEALMEARQFKRIADEKMAHDQQQLVAMEDALYKRDQLIQSLHCEIHAYKHRLMSYGCEEAEIEADTEDIGVVDATDHRQNAEEQIASEPPSQFNSPRVFDYPPLRCRTNETPRSAVDVDKFAFGETPRERLQHLEHRIHRLERTPRHDQTDGGIFSRTRSFAEKTAVAVGQSPRRPRHSRRLSTDSFGIMETPRTIRIGSFKNLEHAASDWGDAMSDRIYTVDSVQGIKCNGCSGAETKVGAGIWDDCMNTPRDSWARGDPGEAEVQKLCMRLQALEADRESMRQAIISMSTDKAQLVLLKEIAQQLYQEMAPDKRPTAKKRFVIGSFSVTSVLKREPGNYKQQAG
ncbi:hypothetical protein ACLOJK_005669 [Asimina triloba]